jgi:asparagine synthase (glutamine-hydrolysing)
VPLLDNRLVEQLFSIHGRQKLNRAVAKPLLVGAVKAELPYEIVHRRKQGFTFPFEHWLRNQMRDEVETSFSTRNDSPLWAAIDRSSAVNVWRDFQNGRTSWSRPWSLHVLQRWCMQNQVCAAA